MSKPRWKNPDKRMARAAELRAQGWSLRRIGTELAVSEATIRNDLARWEGQQQQGEDCDVIPLRNRCEISQAQLRADCASAIAQEEGA
jgi:orotate phosphoribosyltransferase-like protein